MNQEQPIIVGLEHWTTKIAAIAGRKNEYGKTGDTGVWPGQLQWRQAWPGIEYRRDDQGHTDGLDNC